MARYEKGTEGEHVHEMHSNFPRNEEPFIFSNQLDLVIVGLRETGTQYAVLLASPFPETPYFNRELKRLVYPLLNLICPEVE